MEDRLNVHVRRSFGSLMPAVENPGHGNCFFLPQESQSNEFLIVKRHRQTGLRTIDRNDVKPM